MISIYVLRSSSILVQVMSLITKLLPEPVLLDPKEQPSVKFYSKCKHFIQENTLESIIWKNVNPFQSQYVNSSRPGQHGCHFADDVFRCIFREWEVLHFDSRAITWTKANPIPWHIYAALGGDELITDSQYWLIQQHHMDALTVITSCVWPRYIIWAVQLSHPNRCPGYN